MCLLRSLPGGWSPLRMGPVLLPPGRAVSGPGPVLGNSRIISGGVGSGGRAQSRNTWSKAWGEGGGRSSGWTVAQVRPTHALWLNTPAP